MKFLYYGSFGPYNTESWITYALEQEGHEVKQIPKDSFGPSDVVNQLNAEHYDVLLFAKTPSNFDKALEAAKKVGTTSVCWLFDLYWGWRKDVSRETMWKADYVFTTDGGHQEEWEKHSINHHVLRQGIHEPEYVSIDTQKDYDVAFVGSAHYPHRKDLFAFLRENFKFLHINDCRGVALNNKLAGVKVIVGDSVPSPRYWSNRVYEITGRGGFLIHPEVEGFEQEFQTVPTFPHGDFDALKTMIDFFLEHTNERNALKKQQFEECGKYTYNARVKKLCELIQ